MNLSKQHIEELISKCNGVSWSGQVGGVVPSMTKLFNVYTMDDLREIYVYLEDPTGVKFCDAVLHGDQGFLDSMMTSTVVGPHLRVWAEHVTERQISKSLDVMQQMKDNEDLSPSLRLNAAKSIAAFNKGYSRQEKVALRDYQSMKNKQKATMKKMSDEEAEQHKFGVDLDDDFDRIVKGPNVVN